MATTTTPNRRSVRRAANEATGRANGAAPSRGFGEASAAARLYTPRSGSRAVNVSSSAGRRDEPPAAAVGARATSPTCDGGRRRGASGAASIALRIPRWDEPAPRDAPTRRRRRAGWRRHSREPTSRSAPSRRRPTRGTPGDRPGARAIESWRRSGAAHAAHALAPSSAVRRTPAAPARRRTSSSGALVRRTDGAPRRGRPTSPEPGAASAGRPRRRARRRSARDAEDGVHAKLKGRDSE